MQAEDIYINAVRNICPGFNEAELAAFTSIITIRELNKKSIFIQSGKIQKEIGFVVQGLLRSSYIDNEGNEVTVDFYSEGDYATHYPAFITRKPGKYTIQCLEPSTIVCLAYEDIQNAYAQFPAVERYGRLIAEEVLKRQQARIESFIFQTAEERYLNFIEQYPGLFNRISLSHLCSFLGIERQSLTRIRQKLSHQ